MFDARVLEVMIASPGDTNDARNGVDRAVREWNSSRAKDAHVVLLARRWEIDSVPQSSPDGPQSVLNEQLVDQCDIVIAIFASRLGTPTTNAASGTAEEIERASASGKPVHVWFSQEPRPHDVDPRELRALNKFKSEISNTSFYGNYTSVDDLMRHVTRALEEDVRTLVGTAGAVAPAASLSGAPDVRVRWERDARQSRVVIRNADEVRVARRVRLRLESAVEGDDPPIVHMEGEPPTLQPGDEFAYTAISFAGVAMNLRAVLTVEDESGAEQPPFVRHVSRA